MHLKTWVGILNANLRFSTNFVLLFFLPLMNSTFIGAVLIVTDQFSWWLLLHVLVRIWIACFSGWILLCLIDRLTLNAFSFDPDSLQYFAIKYSLAALLALSVFLFLVLESPEPNRSTKAMPIGISIIVGLQLIAAIAIRHTLVQQKKQIYLRTQYQLAQYAALKAQLNPHFLFNTLNLLSAEIKDNPAMAIDIVDELSELLRNVLSQASSPSVPLGQDLDWLEHYFFIQKLRFEDRIKVDLLIDEECRGVKVPPLLLQPVIENCFIHGFGKENENLHIEIKVELTADKLIVSVKDNGSGFELENVKLGYGLTIVKDSLMLLYGKQADFRINSKKGLGTTVDLTIPRRT